MSGKRSRLRQTALIWAVVVPITLALWMLAPGVMRHLQLPRLPFQVPPQLAVLIVFYVGVRFYLWLRSRQEG
jgi:hypothetical protein